MRSGSSPLVGIYGVECGHVALHCCIRNPNMREKQKAHETQLHRTRIAGYAMTTLIMPRRRTGSMSGDPVESRRLLPLFLAYVGRRRASDVFRELNIDVKTGQAWMADKRVLADADQRKLRAAGIGAP